MVNPTLLQIDSIKSATDSADFYVAADDNMYYMYVAGKYLDSMKVKQIDRESEGSIDFKASSGKVYRVNLNDKYWGVILFNGKGKPVVGDITDIEEDYKQYMMK